MDLPIRPWTQEEQPEALMALERAFLSDPAGALQEPMAVLDARRTLSVWDGGRPVATAGSFALSMTLPGAVTPVAGVTLVSVQPTHRRRGLLTAVMRRQLTDLHAGGEAVAALWASEPAIYGRFGYGLAARRLAVELGRDVALRAREAPVDAREEAPQDARHRLAAVWDAACPQRPGEYARDEAWWDHVLFDPENRRDGHTALRCAVLEDGSGYVLFATRAGWGARGPSGSVRIRELVGVDGRSTLRLWSFVLGLDLVATWEARVALDDPLLGAVTDLRALGAQVLDALYVRPVRVGEALAARCYGTDVDVVLDVADPLLPDNARRWRLSGGADGASCEPTTDRADLALGVEELGAVLLGGTTLLSLAAAGRVEELRPGAVAHASRAFRGDTEPFCSHVF